MTLRNIKINNDETINPGIVYDISEATGRTYTDLADALGTDGNNVPESVRKGGMSIRYMTINNKYVQYRLMTQNWSITKSDWQGVNDEITPGSENLVKSGGVNIFGENIKKEILNGWDKNYVDNYYLQYNDGKVYWSSNWRYCLDYIEVFEGETLHWTCGRTDGSPGIILYNSEKVYQRGYGANALERDIVIPSGCKYVRCSFTK